MGAAVSRLTAEMMSEILANISAWKIVVLACGIPLSQLRERTLPGYPSMVQQRQFKQKQWRLPFFDKRISQDKLKPDIVLR